MKISTFVPIRKTVAKAAFLFFYITDAGMECTGGKLFWKGLKIMLFKKFDELHNAREMQYGYIASGFACALERNIVNSPAHNRG